MKKRSDTSSHRLTPDEPRSAGDFSAWLRATHQALRMKSEGADVPCGSCTACCHSSMFIHIRPEEIETRKRIPKVLLFPAPGLPEGNVLMGYDEKGRCPMFVNDRCTIYEYRPQACRDYDCRVFAATGIELDDDAYSLISNTAKNWKFEFPEERDRKDFDAVRAAAEFLQTHKSCFPDGALPRNPAKLASLAILVYDIFRDLAEESEKSGKRPADLEIAKTILSLIGAR